MYWKRSLDQETLWISDIYFGIFHYDLDGGILNRAELKEAEALVPDQRARLQRIIELVQVHGLDRVRKPHVKHLEGRVWKMRIAGQGGIARAFYVTAIGKRVVIVRVFVKKTQKTPRREIELA